MNNIDNIIVGAELSIPSIKLIKGENCWESLLNLMDDHDQLNW